MNTTRICGGFCLRNEQFVISPSVFHWDMTKITKKFEYNNIKFACCSNSWQMHFFLCHSVSEWRRGILFQLPKLTPGGGIFFEGLHLSSLNKKGPATWHSKIWWLQKCLRFNLNGAANEQRGTNAQPPITRWEQVSIATKSTDKSAI